jgi:hypothetical protein
LLNNDKKDPLTLAMESKHAFAKTLQNLLKLAGAKPVDVRITKIFSSNIYRHIQKF